MLGDEKALALGAKMKDDGAPGQRAKSTRHSEPIAILPLQIPSLGSFMCYQSRRLNTTCGASEGKHDQLGSARGAQYVTLPQVAIPLSNRKALVILCPIVAIDRAQAIHRFFKTEGHARLS